VTWNINISGHDDLTGDEKVAYEESIVEEARALVAEIAEATGGHVTVESATTNTTGSVSLLEESQESQESQE